MAKEAPYEIENFPVETSGQYLSEHYSQIKLAENHSSPQAEEAIKYE